MITKTGSEGEFITKSRRVAISPLWSSENQVLYRYIPLLHRLQTHLVVLNQERYIYL